MPAVRERDTSELLLIPDDINAQYDLEGSLDDDALREYKLYLFGLIRKNMATGALAKKDSSSDPKDAVIGNSTMVPLELKRIPHESLILLVSIYPTIAIAINQQILEAMSHEEVNVNSLSNHIYRLVSHFIGTIGYDRARNSNRVFGIGDASGIAQDIMHGVNAQVRNNESRQDNKVKVSYLPIKIYSAQNAPTREPAYA